MNLLVFISVITARMVAQLDFIDFFINSLFAGIGLIFFLFIAIFVGVFVFAFYMICKSMRSTVKTMDTVKLPKTPSPQHERTVIRETLPAECPKCDAPLRYDEVEWVGPRRAACPYCGQTVDLVEQEFTETY
jgi:hypothetical protein